MVQLTVGMATYNDFDGVYFTLQALRLYQDMGDTELLVVDNYGCEHTRNLVEGWVHGRYVRWTDVQGTAAAKDMVLREAAGEVVLCCDSHVLFEPGVIARLKRFFSDRPECDDLLQGPLVYDDLTTISTHFDPVWRDQMWGTWGTDPRGVDPEGEPFEIPMQGMGAFACRKRAWPGFNPRFRGFGGEEGYIHEKFRQAGRRTLCAPWFRWVHRFGRPSGVPYTLRVEDKFRNYVLGHAELGLDLEPVVAHFAEYLPKETLVPIFAEAVVEPPMPASTLPAPATPGEATPAGLEERDVERRTTDGTSFGLSSVAMTVREVDVVAPPPFAAGAERRRPARSPGLVGVPVLDELVVYSSGRDRAFALNTSARAVWELCDGTRTAEEIAAELGRRFGVPAEALLPDVQMTVDQFRSLEILATESGELARAGSHGARP